MNRLKIKMRLVTNKKLVNIFEIRYKILIIITQFNRTKILSTVNK